MAARHVMVSSTLIGKISLRGKERLVVGLNAIIIDYVRQTILKSDSNDELVGADVLLRPGSVVPSDLSTLL